MTEQEAIEDFQRENKILSQYAESKFQKEIFTKRIERNNIAIKALEKQMPKKPTEEKQKPIDFEEFVMICPTCNYEDGCEFEDLRDTKYEYCPMCGQKLDWSEEEWA